MTGKTEFAVGEQALLETLAGKERIQHTLEFLADRLRLFREMSDNAAPPSLCGWKMPPSHIMLHRLLDVDSGLKYTHVVRHGLHMAFSSNQKQLLTWGPVLLDRPVEITPRESLSYWCETHIHIRRLEQQYPSRILQVHFEKLCQDPVRIGGEILAFLDMPEPAATMSAFAGFVKPPDSLGRYKSQDLRVFRASDMVQLELEGYQLLHGRLVKFS